MRIDKGKAFFVYWIAYLIFICLFFYFDNIEQYRNSEKHEVIVSDLLVGKSRHGGEYLYPQFRLSYNDSSYYFAETTARIYRHYSIGDKATTIFPKGRPEQAEYYTILYYWVSLPKLILSLMTAGGLFVFLFIVPVFIRWYKEFRIQYKKSRDK